MNDVLLGIQNWYKDQCNGAWEHSHGLRIETLDNPGWFVEIDIKENIISHGDVEARVFRSDADWWECRIEEGKFRAFGGACNLNEILSRFMDKVVDLKS